MKGLAKSLLLFLLASPFVASASITYNNNDWLTGGGALTNTGGTGSMLLIISQNSTTDNCSITVDGNAATDEGVSWLTGANEYYHIWSYADAPANATLGYTGCSNLYGFDVHEYLGVSTTSNFYNSAGSGASITASLTANNTTDWTVSFASGRFGPHALTASTGVTNDRTNANSIASAGDSTGATGTVTHTWNNADASDNVVFGITLGEAAGGGGGATTTMSTSTATTADVLAFLIPPFIVLAVFWTILGIMMVI